MRSVYAELCVRLLQSEIMLERGMVPDSGIYRSVFCPEGVIRRGVGLSNILDSELIRREPAEGSHG